MSTFTIVSEDATKSDTHLNYTFDSDIIDENLNYLSMYASIKVPVYEMRNIMSLLYTHGKTAITNLVKMISETKYDEIVLRQYIYSLMFKDIIYFELTEPINPETVIWVDEDINELTL